MHIRLVLIKLTLAPLAGCLLACNPAFKSTKQRITRSDTTVNTEAVVQHPNPPPPAILSSKKGSNGSQVDLLKAQVFGDTLTVELQYKAGSEANRIASTYPIDQVSVIDEATAKTYSVLKDQSGSYRASPLQTGQGKQFINIPIPSDKDKPVSVWFKFAAPPIDTKTISITIPDVGSYKNIGVYRSVDK